MFISQKRIFAGKQALRQEPLSPVFTTESGHLSLLKNSLSFDYQSGDTPHARPTYRDGKRR